VPWDMALKERLTDGCKVPHVPVQLKLKWRRRRREMWREEGEWEKDIE
jgi:hypothetical protein